MLILQYNKAKWYFKPAWKIIGIFANKQHYNIIIPGILVILLVFFPLYFNCNV